MNYDKLVETITLIGKEMYTCGAEVNRVEDSLSRILIHYNAESFDVFVITSQITVSAKFEGRNYTIMKRMNNVNVDFTHLAQWNALSRKICAGNLDENQCYDCYNTIITEKKEPWEFILLGSVLCTAGFSVFFGGDWLDALASAVLGLFIFASNILLKKRINNFVYIIMVSFVTSAIGIGFYYMGFGHNLDKMLIGTVMLMIPGMIMTNSVRDIFLGDTIAGTLKIIESLILVICIAVGYGLAILAFAKGTSQNPATEIKWYVLLISGFFGAIGLGLLFNVTDKMLFFSSIGIILITGLYALIYDKTSVFLSSFICSLLAGIFGEIMARLVKTPAIGLISLSLMPLYPGAALYYTFSYLVEQDMEMFTKKLASTGYVILGLACGVVLSAVLFKYINLGIANYKKRKSQK